MREVDRFKNPHAGYTGVTLDVPGSGTQWELLEPLGDDSFLVRFLRERGPGLHHVTLQVESVERATVALQEYGYEPFGSGGHGNYREVYIHPRDTGGVLFQLYEGDWPE
jgi:methylmalonyl-CoA/ethylmalonyl-CoA epimerase